MRTVTVVLAGPDGETLGALAEQQVSTPWWQDVAEIAERTGAQVLRILGADRQAPPGGHVTYLAETTERPASLTKTEDVAPGGPRLPAYAVTGGPRATLDWAASHLPGVPAFQQRTWNLSAIWRLGDQAWIKQVPGFFRHEAAVLTLLGEHAPGLVPRLLASGDEGRMLLAHIPGEDGYGADVEIRERIVSVFHDVQAGLGTPEAVPDRRVLDLGFARAFYDRIDGLEALVDDVPRLWREIAECGLPDTLVHGDLHPGNVRIGPDGRLTIIDWGDCFLGHPAYDILRLTEDLPPDNPVLARWAALWKTSVPGCDPLRAAELIRPMAALRSAGVYAAFLDAIEPSEHPYHAADVPECLQRAADHHRPANRSRHGRPSGSYINR